MYFYSIIHSIRFPAFHLCWERIHWLSPLLHLHSDRTLSVVHVVFPGQQTLPRPSDTQAVYRKARYGLTLGMLCLRFRFNLIFILFPHCSQRHWLVSFQPQTMDAWIRGSLALMGANRAGWGGGWSGCLWEAYLIFEVFWARPTRPRTPG